MANEYLKRTPTSTGNNRVFTWSGWVKRNIFAANYAASQNLFRASGGSGGDCGWRFDLATPADSLRLFLNGAASGNVQADGKNRDSSAWMHVMVAFNSTLDQDSERARIYVNGVRVPDNNTGYPTINYQTSFNERVVQAIGAWDNSGSPTEFLGGQLADVFLVDGQALTPDVFGFYKQGKGYISAGSTQATDFRPGQWVPKTPRVIKTEINRRGGFGVNGFYLPMNDSKNFGADFHGDPNSIITLNEKLSQPRVGVANTASVGLGYTDALRADPYAANLVLAIPGVIGGQGSGYGDYSANIKGSGSNKTVTAVGNAGVAVTASYYGSALNFTGIAGNYFNLGTNADFNFGSGDFTIEFWRNKSRSAIESYVARLDAPGGSATSDFWFGNVSGVDGFYWYQGGTGRNVSSPSLSTNQWDHLAAVRYGNTITLYVNGVAVGVNTTVTYSFNNGTADFRIGGDNANSGNVNYPYQGSIQDLRIYKGVAKYTGGFDVPRPYTPVGIATWRAVSDTTANNFATLNPLIEARPVSGTDSPASSSVVTFAGGNLDLTNSANAGSAQRMVSFATIGISTGRWYWEVRADSNSRVGLSKGFQQRSYQTNFGSGSGLEATVTYEGSSGTVAVGNTAYYSTATTLTAPTYNTSNIIGVAVSANNGLNNLIVQWFKDGVGVATLTGVGATSPVLEWFPSKMMVGSADPNDQKFNFGQNPTFSGNTTAGTFTDSNGKGLFKYQPPSGFLALCEDNLPTPAISNPGQYFKTVLWTGDGNNGRSIVGVGFTPDLVWIKSRSPSAYNHRAFDSVRGAGKDNFLLPNSTAVEGASSDYYGGISSFNNDGFSMVYGTGGSNIGINESGTNFVAWCWRAGAGTTSTNTNGSITSVVSVNQDAGFSIVSYTGTGANATVGHGLGKTPGFIIIKRRSGLSDWAVYHKSIGTAGALILNSTTGTDTNKLPYWNDTSPTITTFGLGNGQNVNASTSTYVAYCWAEIEGFSKFGSYVGNGSADGPMVWCGFKPAWIMIKRTAGAADWVIHDSSRTAVNPSDTILRPNTSDIDLTATTLYVDFLSNGFKIRNANGSYNNSETYIFAAFAESPFQTANSK